MNALHHGCMHGENGVVDDDDGGIDCVRAAKSSTVNGHLNRPVYHKSLGYFY